MSHHPLFAFAGVLEEAFHRIDDEAMERLNAALNAKDGSALIEVLEKVRQDYVDELVEERQALLPCSVDEAIKHLTVVYS